MKRMREIFWNTVDSRCELDDETDFFFFPLFLIAFLYFFLSFLPSLLYFSLSFILFLFLLFQVTQDDINEGPCFILQNQNLSEHLPVDKNGNAILPIVRAMNRGIESKIKNKNNWYVLSYFSFFLFYSFFYFSFFLIFVLSLFLYIDIR